MIIVVVSVKVKEGFLEEFLTLFKANVPNVLAEEGCIEYMPAVDAPTSFPPQSLDPQVVTIVEKWESLEALEKHLATPHMLAYREKTKTMVEGMDLKILREA